MEATAITTNELYQKACMLPLLPGVYIIRDKKNVIIYIGKAKRLKTRVSQYFREGVPHDTKVTKMIQNAFEFDVIVTQSEFEALVLEASQIKQHLPKYNILLKDDKGYSYIGITREDYPRISACLQKDDEKGKDYIGPFTSSFAVREMVETANLVFKLPTCHRRFPQDIGKGRPCLNAHIGRCMAVCSGKITKPQYNGIVKNAVHLIKYGRTDIVKMLTSDMEDAAERLDFERAAILRDQISAIEKVNRGQKVVSSENKEQDVIAFIQSPTAVCAAILRFREGRLVDKREFVFDDKQDIDEVRDEFVAQYYLQGADIPKVIVVDAQFDDMEILREVLAQKRGTKVQIYVPARGDNAQLIEMAKVNASERLARESGRFTRTERVLDELSALLGQKQAPITIESYDISNWGDGTSVAGMIVFENGKPKRAGYRRFKMKTVFVQDDYASMAETLSRRTAEYENNAKGQFGIKPDLILLDGGKGQLSVVIKALENTAFADVPIFGMVKDNKHRTRAIVGKEGEISLSPNKNVFAFVSSIQDEVHRFSIEYQRKSQKSKSYKSTLNDIKGVGPARVTALLAHFKTLAAIKLASVEQLCEVKGVTKTCAQEIYDFFHVIAQRTENISIK